MASLVVYYSRADENYFGGVMRSIPVGNTERLARQIALEKGAELFSIQQKVPYAKDYATCIQEAKRDLKAKARPELVTLLESLDGYDDIYLGYPNYWGTMPMAVYTFLENYDWKGKRIHPFCTHEGSGLANAERDVEHAAKGSVVTPGLAIFGSSVDQAAPKVKAWLKTT